MPGASSAPPGVRTPAMSWPGTGRGGRASASATVMPLRLAGRRWGWGTAGHALGAGLGSAVQALAVVGRTLYAGGYFSTAGGVAANHIAAWDGTAWHALGAGTDGYVQALAVMGSTLYAGGQFSTAGGA